MPKPNYLPLRTEAEAKRIRQRNTDRQAAAIQKKLAVRRAIEERKIALESEIDYEDTLGDDDGVI